MRKIAIKAVKILAIAIVWLLIWEIIHRIVGRDLIVPSPLSVIKRIFELALEGRFWKNIGLSMLRILIGYMSALVLGSLIGLVTALSRILDSFLSPISKIIKATPVASFIILLFVFLARNNIPAFTAFLMVLPIAWANIYEGIKNTDRKLLEMARVFSLKKGVVLRKIYIPSVLPFFMASAKAGMGLAWKAGIAAEVLTNPSNGIGTALYNSKVYLEITDLFAWTAVIVIISVILERLFVVLLKRSRFYS